MYTFAILKETQTETARNLYLEMLLMSVWMRSRGCLDRLDEVSRDSQCTLNITCDMSASKRSAKSCIFSPGIPVSSPGP